MFELQLLPLCNNYWLEYPNPHHTRVLQCSSSQAIEAIRRREIPPLTDEVRASMGMKRETNGKFEYHISWRFSIGDILVHKVRNHIHITYQMIINSLNSYYFITLSDQIFISICILFHPFTIRTRHPSAAEYV